MEEIKSIIQSFVQEIPKSKYITTETTYLSLEIRSKTNIVNLIIISNTKFKFKAGNIFSIVNIISADVIKASNYKSLVLKTGDGHTALIRLSNEGIK